MAQIDLGGRECSDAHAQVLSGELGWALFTLPPNNALRLSGTGDSIDDLADEFEDGRIEFGFVRVVDPISKLPRFVLVQWCGEGVPVSRKGLFASHCATVASRLLKGSHVTIQARTQDDLEPANIMKRVSNASGSKYSVHNEVAQRIERPAPVGSAYVPVGRPDIAAMTANQKRQAPAVVGTAYESKRNELADIRAGKQVDAPIPSAPRPAQPVGARYVAPSSVPSVPSAPPRPALASSGSSLQKPGSSLARAPSPVTSPPVSAAHISAPTPPLPSSGASVQGDRPEPVGTAYTPVSLGKPGKLGNRFPFGQQAQSQPDPVHTPAKVSGAGLTWSQRQEQAKKQREEEDARARSAIESVPAAPPAPPVASRPVAPAVVPSSLRAPAVVAESEPAIEEPEVAVAPPPPPPPPPPPAAPLAASGAALGAKLAEQEADLHQRQHEDELAQQTAKLDQLKVAEVQAHEAAARGQRAVVLFPYSKDEDNEIDLEEGEELSEIQQIDEGWWQGERSNGETGLFPSTYVQLLEGDETAPAVAQELESEPFVEESVVPPPPPPPPPAPAMAAVPVAPPRPVVPEPEPEPEPQPEIEATGNPPFAIALYEYAADEENETSFAEGERISDIEFVDEAWWQGTTAAGRGLFPANYVQLEE